MERGDLAGYFQDGLSKPSVSVTVADINGDGPEDLIIGADWTYPAGRGVTGLVVTTCHDGCQER